MWGVLKLGWVGWNAAAIALSGPRPVVGYLGWPVARQRAYQPAAKLQVPECKRPLLLDLQAVPGPGLTRS
jgi:hypothetical protein